MTEEFRKWAQSRVVGSSYYAEGNGEPEIEAAFWTRALSDEFDREFQSGEHSDYTQAVLAVKRRFGIGGIE